MVFKLIKLLLSIVFFGLAVLIIVMYFEGTTDGKSLSLAGMFLICTAAPWVKFTKPSRELGLFVLIISFTIFILAFMTALGSFALPATCGSGKGYYVCNIENYLYQNGGYYAASVIWFFFAFIVLLASITIFKKSATRAMSSATH